MREMEARLNQDQVAAFGRVERANEARIEQVGALIMRGIIHRDVRFAFTSWAEICNRRSFAIGRLRLAAWRLRQDAKAKAFATWVNASIAWKMAARDASRKQRRFAKAEVASAEAAAKEAATAEILKQLAAREEEIGALKTKYSDATAAAQDGAADAAAKQAAVDNLQKRLSLREKELADMANLHEQELAAAAEERAAMARAHQKHVEEMAGQKEAMHMERFAQQARRRLLYRDLEVGFHAWMEFWSSRVHALQTMKRVANRLHPRSAALASAFYFWVDDASGANWKAEIEAYEKRANKMQMMIEVRDKEISRLKLELLIAQASDPSAGAFARGKREKQIRALEKKKAKEGS